VSAESRRVFDQFVNRHGVESNDAFEQLCAAFPGMAPELKKLREQHRQDSLPANAARPATVVETLMKRYGRDIDPGVSLDPAEQQKPRAPQTGASDPIVQKIAQHSSPSPRYTFKGEVARGGMGAILKVWDGDLRRNLAMKVILGEHEDPAEDPQRIARFLEEAQVTGQLDHPGIVPVHELGVSPDGRVYFTMRLIHGRDFQTILDLVREGREGWNDTRALGTIQRACEAMAFAHSKGVIHRDLKPANIMVGNFGETYVMDWGLAKVIGKQDHKITRSRKVTDSMDESGVKTVRRDAAAKEPASAYLTLDGEVLGTPCYMSPEQAHGKVQEMGPTSDVYSMGAIIYHLLSGQMPYVEPGTNPSPYAILDKVKKGPPRPLQEINPKLHAEIIAICEKAMARDPHMRYADMRAMADDLRAYLEGRVVKAYATGAFVEFKKWVLRNKSTAASILAAILVAIGGLWLMLKQEQKHNEQLKSANDLITAEKKNVEGKNRELANANIEIQKARDEAERNAETARKNEQEALKNLSAYQRMSDVKRLNDLHESAELYLATYPPPQEKLKDWLVAARDLATRLPPHRAKLEWLQQEIASRKDKLGPDELNDLRWQHSVTSDLVRGLTEILEEKGLSARVRAALRLWDLTISADSGWAQAVASIGSAKETPAYGGLHIDAQYGLKPLGKDPVSGLWEFLQVETGEAPVRDASGRWMIKEETGIVFVLVPGGTFDMGCIKPNAQNPKNSPNVDEFAEVDEGPVHPVTLKPFFISKYEITQAQWKRLTGEDPSWLFRNATNTATLPVTGVNWEMCMKALPKVGLTLPTEAQWEYGARAGTSTVWWTGNVEKTLEGAANIRGDRDGFMDSVAPVGTYRPNRFGLYDSAGNVWEWCLDEYRSYNATNSSAEGSAVDDVHSRRRKVLRGGGYNDAASDTRSGHRSFNHATFRMSDTGVRPVYLLK
jgi:formylglycine-generating enzyme required for sulfatase activity/serine/threonine protein kinase